MSLSSMNAAPYIVLYNKQSSSNLGAYHRATMVSSPGALFISMIVVGFLNVIDWNAVLVDAVHLRRSPRPAGEVYVRAGLYAWNEQFLSQKSTWENYWVTLYACMKNTRIPFSEFNQKIIKDDLDSDGLFETAEYEVPDGTELSLNLKSGLQTSVSTQEEYFVFYTTQGNRKTLHVWNFDEMTKKSPMMDDMQLYACPAAKLSPEDVKKVRDGLRTRQSDVPVTRHNNRHVNLKTGRQSAVEGRPEREVFYRLTPKEKKDETLILRRFRLAVPGAALGEGSYSIARRALDTQTNEAVCVKVYKQETGIDRQDTRRRFRRQVAVLRKLGKPLEEREMKKVKVFSKKVKKSFQVNPASLFEKLIAAGEEKGKFYVVTELAAPSEGLRRQGYGASLQDYLTAIREGVVAPPTFPEIQEITKAVVLGGAMLHAKGLVHLDFKPANVLNFGTTWKWIDMDGCIDMWTDDAPTRISSDNVKQNRKELAYTEIYSGPEIARFITKRDPYLEMNGHLDVWSVGISLCELATLSPVLQPTCETFLEGHSFLVGFENFWKWLADANDNDDEYLDDVFAKFEYPRPNEQMNLSSWRDPGKIKKKSPELSRFVDLLKKMLMTSSSHRLTFAECLNHEFLDTWSPQPSCRCLPPFNILRILKR